MLLCKPHLENLMRIHSSFISDVKQVGVFVQHLFKKMHSHALKACFLSLTRGIRLVLFTRLKRLCRASNSISFTSAFNWSSFCRSSLSSFIRRSIRARWCKSSAKETYSIRHKATRLNNTSPHTHDKQMQKQLILDRNWPLLQKSSQWLNFQRFDVTNHTIPLISSS